MLKNLPGQSDNDNVGVLWLTGKVLNSRISTNLILKGYSLSTARETIFSFKKELQYLQCSFSSLSAIDNLHMTIGFSRDFFQLFTGTTNYIMAIEGNDFEKEKWRKAASFLYSLFSSINSLIYDKH